MEHLSNCYPTRIMHMKITRNEAVCKNAELKRMISWALFDLGIVGGLAGCAIYPMAVFTVGANDSSQEVWGSLLFSYRFFPHPFWLYASDCLQVA